MSNTAIEVEVHDLESSTGTIRLKNSESQYGVIAKAPNASIQQLHPGNL